MKELQIGETKVAVAAEAKEFLGRIVWYSVSEAPVDFETLENFLRQENVPAELWPKRTRPVDAFKLAVRSVQGKDYVVDYDTTVQDAKKVTDHSTMLVVERVRDTQLDALPVKFKVHFDKDKETLRFDANGGSAFGDLKLCEVRDAIEEAYDTYRTCFSEKDIRAMLSQALKAGKSFVLKKHGGIYFVPEDYGPTAEALARVVEHIPGCEMVAVPVIDREPERKTLLKRYESATVERTKELMLSVKGLLDSKETLKPSTFEKIYKEVQYLKEQRAKYEEILSDTMDMVAIELEALNKYLGKLADRLGTDEPS